MEPDDRSSRIRTGFQLDGRQRLDVHARLIGSGSRTFYRRGLRDVGPVFKWVRYRTDPCSWRKYSLGIGFETEADGWVFQRRTA